MEPKWLWCDVITSHRRQYDVMCLLGIWPPLAPPPPPPIFLSMVPHNILTLPTPMVRQFLHVRLLFSMFTVLSYRLLSGLVKNCFASLQCDKISIFHGCMVWIEKSVTRVNDRYHEACRVMPNSDPEWQIFVSTPYTHDRYFFLYTFWLTTFDFQSRTCNKIALFSFKEFLLMF